MDFIRKNPALAVGIGLPILVVLLFGLAATLPKWLVASPQYNGLFYASVYARSNALDYEIKLSVDNGHLKAYRRNNSKQGQPGFDARYYENHLYMFDAKKQSVHEIALPLYNGPVSDEWQEFSIPEIDAVTTLDPSATSPDGYLFRDRYGNGSGINEWPFFFGSTYSHRGISISKDGRDIELPFAGNEDYYSSIQDVHFLGWITAGDVK